MSDLNDKSLKSTYDQMKRQMTPSDELMRRLNTRLAAEDAVINGEKTAALESRSNAEDTKADVDLPSDDGVLDRAYMQGTNADVDLPSEEGVLDEGYIQDTNRTQGMQSMQGTQSTQGMQSTQDTKEPEVSFEEAARANPVAGSKPESLSTFTKVKTRDRSGLTAIAAALAVVGIGFALVLGWGVFGRGYSSSGDSNQAGWSVGNSAIPVYTAADYENVYDEIVASKAFAWSFGDGSGSVNAALSPEEAGNPEAGDGSNAAAGPNFNLGNSSDENLVLDNGLALPEVPASPNGSGQGITGLDDAGSESEKSEAAAYPESVSDTEDTLGYSGTNNQVRQLDEGDIVKTDGRYIYTLSRAYQSSEYVVTLSVVRALGAGTSVVSQFEVYRADPSAAETIGSPDDIYSNKAYYGSNVSYEEMYLSGSTIVLVSTQLSYADSDVGYYRAPEHTTKVELIDVSDTAKPKLVWSYGQSGTYYQGRMVDGKLYLLSSYYLTVLPDAEQPETYVPSFQTDSQSWLCPPDDIAFMPVIDVLNYAVIGSIDISERRFIDQASVLGSADTFYMSSNNLYICSSVYEETASEPYQDGIYTVTDYQSSSSTQITRVAISNGNLSVMAQSVVPGSLLNQFSVDEWRGNLRVAVTITIGGYKLFEDAQRGFRFYEWQDTEISNGLLILSPEGEVIGSITELAKDESIYSVRFMGPIAYMVTFRQVDPLFAVDLSDPQAPKVLSTLKIPGFSRYMHPWTAGLLFGFGNDATEQGRIGNVKLSMFDISNPADIWESSKLVTEFSGASALYSHKALLVLPQLNLIGFADDRGYYHLYRYENDSFVQVASLEFGSAEAGSGYYSNETRAIYVGENLYIFSENYLDVYSLSDYQHLASIKLVDGDIWGYMGIEPLVE